MSAWGNRYRIEALRSSLRIHWFLLSAAAASAHEGLWHSRLACHVAGIQNLPAGKFELTVEMFPGVH